MRQEARVISLLNSGSRVNVWNSYIPSYLADYISNDWAQSGLQGAYNDDLLKMLGPSEFPIDKGGHLIEYNGQVNSTDASDAYQVGFAAILAAIGAKSKSKYIAGNISGVNLFGSVNFQALLAALSFFLREQYLTAGLGLTGYSGLQKMWDNFAYAAIGKKSLIQGQLWDGAVRLADKTKRSNWERDIGTLLAEYYLMNVPGYTSFQSWGNGYYYGSANTFTYNYYKAGVPMNMAYQVYDYYYSRSITLLTLTSNSFLAYCDAEGRHRNSADISEESIALSRPRVHDLPDDYQSPTEWLYRYRKHNLYQAVSSGAFSTGLLECDSIFDLLPADRSIPSLHTHHPCELRIGQRIH